MFCDSHVHCMEGDGNDVLRELNRCGIRRMLAIAPYMGDEKLTLSNMSAEAQKRSTDAIIRLCTPDPARLVPFAWIEPRLQGAVEAVRYAAERGVRGIKMIPAHWYPYEERLLPVYAEIERHGLPVLFHSGILYAFEDSSRFCRPCFFEALLHFPRIKFALAHISWPWTDECIATAGRMMAYAHEHRRPMQMYIDITRGTPDLWRKDALHKAIEFAGATRLMYGSDSSAPGDLMRSAGDAEKDRQIIVEQLKYGQDVYEQIVNKTFEDFLTPMP